MEAANPFAQVPTTPEPIIAQVRRQLADDAWPGLTDHPTVLDRVADRAVRELWESPVKTFVPVLALRQAREVLREQWQAITAEQAEIRAVDESAAMHRPGERARQDVFPIDDDILSRDGRDVLSL